MDAKTILKSLHKHGKLCTENLRTDFKHLYY